MTRYLEYAGLHGEPIRVPSDTIAKGLALQPGDPYPFVRTAQKLGADRDRYATIAMSARPWFEDARRCRGTLALMVRRKQLAAA